MHPAAGAFPLLSEKELKHLAGDIQRNDLRADVVLWRPDDKTEPALLDGRNRLDALALIVGRGELGSPLQPRAGRKKKDPGVFFPVALNPRSLLRST